MSTIKSDTADLTLNADGASSALKLQVDGTEKASLGSVGLDFPDSVKARFGTSQDLQLWHDGANSYIKDDGTGDLILQGSTDIRLQSTGGENMVVAQKDGAVYIYHNNILKFETASTGCSVTGLAITGPITEQETVKTASFTPNLTTDGTIFDISGSLTITMPAATAGKSFTIIDSGSGTLTWAGTIKWNGGAAPSPSGITIYSFISNGTDWYGMQAGTGFA